LSRGFSKLFEKSFAGGFAGVALGQDSVAPGGGGCGPGIGKLKKGLDKRRVL